MNSFTQLHFDLIALHGRSRRVERLRAYFQSVLDKRDRRWANLLLRDNFRSRFIQYGELREYASAYTGLPLWLIEESIEHAGNVTEAISLIVASRNQNGSIPLHVVMERINDRKTGLYEDKVQFVQSVWGTLPERSVILFNRLITGGYTSPVSIREIEESSATADTGPKSVRTIKTVLLYASPNEYTFAIWKDELLVPLVKTSDGMSPGDRLHVRQFVANNTRERFGPVHSVNPELIFEIGFEDIERAPRRKSGVKLISPRITGRCHNAGLDDISRVEDLTPLIRSDLP